MKHQLPRVFFFELTYREPIRHWQTADQPKGASPG